MAADGDVLLGKWWNGPKDAHIEIYKCGDKFCGKIVFLSEPNEVDGTPKIDDENPEFLQQITNYIQTVDQTSGEFYKTYLLYK